MWLLSKFRHCSEVSHDSKQGSANNMSRSTTGSAASFLSGMPSGVAEALSFDRIVAGGACPPCTTRDFLNYMKYVEHAAENLQFFLWFRDYCQRFEQLSASEKDLSPSWTTAQADAESQSIRPLRSRRVDPVIASVPRDTPFSGAIAQPIANSDRGNPFHDCSRPTSEAETRATTGSEHGSSFSDEQAIGSTPTSATARRADDAFQHVGATWRPFTAQPFRQETIRIISVYIAVDAPRQLNLSGRERMAVLRALQTTTHPSAFHAAVSTVEFSLRRQAHPNFVRWSISNGNRPRVVFAHGLGIVLILASVLSSTLITLSHANRSWRIMPFLGYLGGTSTLIAACMGLCVVLHGWHHTHLRPWELFADDRDAQHEGNLVPTGLASCESLTSTFSNSYEDEPWVARYERRNIVRKIFDREIWIQEPAIRRIQDAIFVQSVVCGLILSVIIVGIFCAFPSGNLF